MKQHSWTAVLIDFSIQWCADCGMLAKAIGVIGKEQVLAPAGSPSSYENCVPNEAGVLPEGANPEEIHPRKESWLAERSDWEDRVSALESQIDDILCDYDENTDTVCAEEVA